MTTTIGNSNFFNEVCYTGGIYDVSTGLYYLNARYYDPRNGRFITRDTYRGELNEPETLHLYAYCDNNPINYTAPSGHWAVFVGIQYSFSCIISGSFTYGLAVDSGGRLSICGTRAFGIEVGLPSIGLTMQVCAYPKIQKTTSLAGRSFNAGADAKFGLFTFGGGVSINSSITG